MRIRTAELRDCRAIRAIYAQYIESPVTFEYRLPDPKSFEDRFQSVSSAYPWLVCEEDGYVIGYAYAHPHQEREGYRWNAELSVYLDKAYTKRGYGKRLYARLIELLKEQGIKNVYGAVTLPNEASEKLHKSLGFTCLGILHHTGFKCGKWHDVAWFEMQIGMIDGSPAELIPSKKS